MAYKRILVPVDASAASRNGLRAAIKAAREARARLRLVHVVDERQAITVPEVGAAGVMPVLDALKGAGRKTLKRVEAAAKRSGVQTEAVLVEDYAGPVADAIVQQARRFRADLIVMGTHGRRGVARALLGSDAEMVVRRSSIPVLLVPGRR